MNDALIQFAKVGFRYETGSPVISELSFTLSAGRRVGVVGVSGAGKTTLLRLASGRLAPNTGVVSRAPVVDPTRSGKFGLVAQGENLFPWRTVAENLQLARRSPTKRTLEAWATTAMEQLWLNPELLQKYPAALSVGMRKRVEIIRALAAPTIMLLADEPFAPLDQKTTVAARTWIDDQLHSSQGAMLLVTHDLTLVAEWCHEVLLFKKSGEGTVSNLRNPVCGLESETRESREFRLELAKSIGAI